MHMSHTTTPRRTVLLGATAVGLGAAAGFRIPTSEARAPIVSGQVPYFYRFMVGKFQATVVSDGPLPLGEPSATLKGHTKGELAKALANNFLPTDNLVLEQRAAGSSCSTVAWALRTRSALRPVVSLAASTRQRSVLPQSTTLSARMVTLTMSAASLMQGAGAISRTPRFGSRRLITTFGQTKANSQAT